MTSGFDFEGRAAAAVAAHKEFDAAFNQVTHRDDDNHPATRRWHEAQVGAARAIDETFPGGFWKAWNYVTNRDVSDLENLLAFLEADPWFPNSGFLKDRIIRRLKQENLAPETIIRLIAVIETRIRNGPGTMEYKYYVRLGGKLARSHFVQIALELWDSEDRRTARRARDALMRLDNAKWRKLRFVPRVKPE